MAGGDMSEIWSERAELYRTSAAHVEGPDLDLIVEWAEGCRTAIDVATGGGHVARRLRETGVEVVSCDPAPGMRPDVICFAEDLPFADGAFELSVTRVAAHHFADPATAARELGRVASTRVIVADTIYDGDKLERAEKLRDPSHVRNYSEAEWRGYLEGAGLVIEEVRIFDHPVELEPWLVRTGCTGADADAARELLADRMDGGFFKLDRIALRARPA
jgi:SAM-dependent methyltransferase